MRKYNKLVDGIVYSILSICLVLTIVPLYFTITTAFKSPSMQSKNFFGLPTDIYLDNFVLIFKKADVGAFFGNSLLITAFSVILIVIFVPAVSFSISRNFGKRYYNLLYFLIIGGTFVPFPAIIVSELKLANFLGLLHPLGMVPIYVGIAFSSNVFLTAGYLKSIPKELDESAFMDGAGVYQTFFKIIYPLLRPINATVAILAALWIWNDFLLPLVMLNREMRYWTVPMFQYNFNTGYYFNYNQAAAALFISIVPIIVFYISMQRFIISGLVKGAVKG